VKKNICVECGKNVETCEDRFDMYDMDGKKPKLMNKGIKMVWGNAWELSKNLAKEKK
jgi:hypothetical protein